jgi:hypothetical protein
MIKYLNFIKLLLEKIELLSNLKHILPTDFIEEKPLPEFIVVVYILIIGLAFLSLQIKVLANM